MYTEGFLRGEPRALSGRGSNDKLLQNCQLKLVSIKNALISVLMPKPE